MSTNDGGNGAARGFAVVMEPDADLRGMICTALLLEGHRVECADDCKSVLSFRESLGGAPGDLLLALGAGNPDPDWGRLRRALDDDPVLSQAPVIVLLTIRNGLSFPKRARIVQKPFALDALLALVAADFEAARVKPS
jgi:DNA-binding response OmpR family regulator